MLDAQRVMEHKRKRNNLRTLFGVQRIPGADQIRNMVDKIEPEALPGAFNTALARAHEACLLEHYRILHGYYLWRWTGHGIVHRRRYTASSA